MANAYLSVENVLVRWTMSKLSPVMSSMAMFFQVVVEAVSPIHATVQGESALNDSPGLGELGVTSARTRIGEARASKNVSVEVENILLLGCKNNTKTWLRMK